MSEQSSRYQDKILPDGWVWTSLGEIRIDKSYSVNPSKASKDYFELYSVPSHTYGKPEILLGSEIGSNKRAVTENTVLLCRINPHINRSWIVGNFSKYKKIASTEWVPFFNRDEVLPKYIFYFFQNPDFRDNLQLNVSGVGGSLTRARISAIEDYDFPFAPLPEQKRIVAKIEELFTQLDAGVTALKRAQANLKRYKASVLKAACEGRLVPTEAELHPDDYEPASVLLERILKERRAKWEADLIAEGKDPSKRKYKEPAQPDVENLPELPEGWVWVTVGKLGDVIGGLTKNPKRKEMPKKLPYLRVANVYANELRLDDVREIGIKDNELERALLQKDDLLVVEGNGSIEQIGRVSLWNDSISPCAHQNHLIKVRFHIRQIAQYVLFWLLSEEGRKHITLIASSTSGLYTLNLSKVSSLPIPLPPLEEQRRIVDEIEVMLSIVESANNTFCASKGRSERLHQAILKQAFEGKLVPQDPNDEPASVLLERVREGKEG